MFEKFGEFDSYKEINELAENLFNEGDMDSIKALAEENGIDKGFADAYIAGEIAELTDPLNAAVGKLDIECKELKLEEIMVDWVEYIKDQCINDLMAHQVRKKGRSLKGCIAALLKWSFGHQQNIDQDILKAAGVKAGRVTLGIPGMGQAKRIIRDYYLGGAAR